VNFSKKRPGKKVEKGLDNTMVRMIIDIMQKLEQSSTRHERTYAPIREDGWAFQVASLQVRSPFFERSEP